MIQYLIEIMNYEYLLIFGITNYSFLRFNLTQDWPLSYSYADVNRTGEIQHERTWHYGREMETEREKKGREGERVRERDA